MSGILRLESLTKGNTLKQGDKTPLKYRLFDADGEKLNIAGKSAQVRLVYPDFLTIGYEKDGLTVTQDDTVTFTIDSVIPARIYHVEIIVDDQFIFPSRADESKFTVDKSSLGTEANIIEIVGVDAIVRKAVDLINDDPSLLIDEAKLISAIIAQTPVGSIEEYYQEYRDAIKEYADLKPKAELSVSKSAEALTLSKSVQEQFNQVVIDGDSSVESAQARVDTSGQTNPTLKARLDKEHNEVTAQLAQTAKKSEVEVERQRINNLMQLPEGSTSGDAQLSDIKIGADGVEYATPAEAIRSNDNLLNKKLGTLTNQETVPASYFAWERGSMRADGKVPDTASPTRIRSGFIPFPEGGFINLTDREINVKIYVYTALEEFVYLKSLDYGEHIIEETSSIKVVVSYQDDREISDVDLHSLPSKIRLTRKANDLNRLSDFGERVREAIDIISIDGDNLVWERGSMRADGKVSDTASPTRVRSGFIGLPYGGEFIIDETRLLKYNLYLYDINSGKFIESTGFRSNPTYLESGYKVRILIAHTDDREVNEIEDVTSYITILTTSRPLVNREDGTKYTWTHGSMRADGKVPDTALPTRVRSEMIPFPEGGFIDLANENHLYKYSVYIYEDDNTFLGLSGFRTEKLYIESNKKVIVLVSYQDNREISSNDIDQLAQKIKLEKINNSNNTSASNNHSGKYVFSDELHGIYTVDSVDKIQNPSIVQTEEVYEWYDELKSQFPTYIQSEVRGSLAGGEQVNLYKFTPRRLNSTVEIKLPKIIIFSGTHGNEKGPVYSLFQFLKDICVNWRNDKILEFFRFNVDFIIVPIVNPFGFNANDRYNANGVDLNRDYPERDGWTYANAQDETKIVMDVLEEHSDAEYVIDYHNKGFDGKHYGVYMTYALTSNTVINDLVTKVQDTIGRQWQKDYDFFPQGDDYLNGFTIDEIKGSLAYHATAYGMKDLLLEIARDVRYQSEYSSYDEVAIKTGIDLLGNTLKELVKHLM